MQKAQDQQSRALEEQQRQAQIASENNARMIAAAEYDRAQAVREQTQALLEQGTTDREAHKRGYEYVDYEWGNGNPANFWLYIEEHGKNSTYNHSYLYNSNRLRHKFSQGLDERIRKMSWDPATVRKNFKGAAHAVGHTYCLNPDRKKLFCLDAEVRFAGRDITSKNYDSTFRWEVDLKDGTVYPQWSDHFEDAELNKQYRLGVEEALLIVNSDEAKEERLKTLVPQLKKNERQKSWRAAKIKFIDFMFTLGCAAIAFFSFIFILGFTSGLWMFLALIVPIGLWIQLREYQNEWRFFYQTIGILDK
jgi:hypothetical protein